MLTSALFATNNGVLERDFVQEVLVNFPEASEECPLYTSLLSRGLITPTVNPQFDWRTMALPGRRNQVNNGGAAYDANTTSIVVDDASVYPIGHLIVSETTREVMLVTARNLGTNTLTVVRGIGATNGGVAAAAGSVANDEWLAVIGSAAGEGSRAMAFRAATLAPAWNYTQRFKETVLFSGTVAGSSTEHQHPREYERLQKFQIAIRNIERALMFGSRGTATNADGETVHATHGLFNAISTNRVVGIGNITRNNVNDVYAPALFRTGSKRKLAICGTTAKAMLSRIFRGNEQRSPGEMRGGVPVTTIDTDFGTLDLTLSRAFEGAFAGAVLIVDVSEATRLRPLGRPANKRTPALTGQLQLVEGTQENDRDGEQDEWRADLGLQWGNEADHGLWLGITGAA